MGQSIMPRFDTANSRDMAARSVAARKRKAERDAAETERSANLAPGPLETGVPAGDSFTLERLARVRAILERLDRMAARGKDAQELAWLATASARWSEQEFDLSGRPKPGHRRPGPERAPRGGVFWGAGRPAPAPSNDPGPG